MVSCLCNFVYVERHIAFNFSGLHTGRYHRLYVLKDGGYNVVPTRGGGGDTTELETRLSTVDTALPLMAETSTVVDLSGIVTRKAEQTALVALSASSINQQANHVLVCTSGVLQKLDMQLPRRMTTDDATNSMQLQIGWRISIGFPRNLRHDHAH